MKRPKRPIVPIPDWVLVDVEYPDMQTWDDLLAHALDAIVAVGPPAAPREIRRRERFVERLLLEPPP